MEGRQARPARPGRVLLTGWFSFLHGETTAGDVLALDRVRAVLDRAGTAYDTAWSPRFRPDALHLEDADPAAYSHLVFICGPLHGPQIERLHTRFPHCERIAVGTSVLDPADPAAAGFHRVVARDAPGSPPARDLAAAAPARPTTPVVGVVLTQGQLEYGPRRRHGEVADALARWLAGKDCARLDLDTRLDAADWRLCAHPGQLESAMARLDCVVTDRLHGLVIALRCGTPALAVDPVRGGAKVTAQAAACGWPALLPAERVAADGGEAELDRWWDWCLGPGRALATRRRADFASPAAPDLATDLLSALRPDGLRPA